MKSWRLKLPPKFQRQVENLNTTSVFHHFTVYLHLQFEGFLILLIIVKGEVLLIYLIYIIPHRNILYTTVLNALQFYIISTSVFVRKKFLFCMIEVTDSTQQIYDCLLTIAYTRKICLRI